MKLDAFGFWLVATAALLTWPRAAQAAVSCSVDSSGVAFGDIAVISGASQDGVGDLTIGCTWDGQESGDVTYSVALSSGGGAAGFSPRRMRSGAYELDYNLYTSGAHAIVWGDGAGSTQIVTGSAWTLSNPNVQETRQHSVYGRIEGGQQRAHVGVYGDIVSITVSY